MILSNLLIAAIRLLVGATPRHSQCKPVKQQAIYFANHSSHMDTVAIWSALPPSQRKITHPVAALDYWGKTAFRRYIVLKGLNAVLIDREKPRIQIGNASDHDVLQPLKEVLAKGESLIIFPEGTRGTERLPTKFKSGIFYLAKEFPDALLVPVYLDNLHRSMPKGSFFPVPFICTVHFGSPLERIQDESKDLFLNRCHQSVINLSI